MQAIISLLVCVFLFGKYDEKNSDDELLEGFRSQDLETLKEEAKKGKLVARNTNRNPFDFVINRIRQKFNVDDIIKLLMIDIRYYDSDDFKKIVSYNFDIAKSLYEQYIDQADGEQAFSKEKKFVPKDVEIYCPMFNIKTNSGCIYSALKDGDINTLINILKYTCVGSIEVVYRHYNLNLFGKKKIIRLLDTI